MNKVTLDTNIVNDAAILAAATAAGFEVVHTSVTDRELEASGIIPASSKPGGLLEGLVIGESRIGSAVIESTVGANTFERLLQIISNGSFPPSGQRSNLSDAQKRQLRDTMILSAHIRDGRDVFVTNDERGFIRNGRRERIEQEFRTRIMTSEDFLEFCNYKQSGG
jgi:hypothetical protein